MNYTTVNTWDTLITSKNKSKYICQQKPAKTTQETSLTYKSGAHQQLLSITTQEAHTITGVLNKGHLADFSQSMTHAVTTLCLHKPWWQQQKLSYAWSPWEEEEEAKIHCPLEAPATSNTSEIPLTSYLDEHPKHLEDLEDLVGLVNLMDQKVMPQIFPLLTLSLFHTEPT